MYLLGVFFPHARIWLAEKEGGGGCLMSQPVRFSYSEAWNPAELGDSFAGFRTVSLLQDAASSGSPRGFSVSETVWMRQFKADHRAGFLFEILRPDSCNFLQNVMTIFPLLLERFTKWEEILVKNMNKHSLFYLYIYCIYMRLKQVIKREDKGVNCYILHFLFPPALCFSWHKTKTFTFTKMLKINQQNAGN